MKYIITIQEEDKEAEAISIETQDKEKPHLDILANTFFWIASCLSSPLKKLEMELKDTKLEKNEGEEDDN